MLAAPPGTWAAMRSIAAWLSDASGSIDGVIRAQPDAMRFAGMSTASATVIDAEKPAKVGCKTDG